LAFMNVITKTDDLAAFCATALDHDFVTIDTEFHRETTYWPDLCLVQAATQDEAVIIDPLAKEISLDPLFALLADERVTKVFHAARQDVEIFVKLTGAVPANIYDTQIAASVCGYGDSASYDSLVQSIVGEQIDKSSRFTDWAARPLTDKQLKYAVADVTHLRDVYLALRERIGENGRSNWVAEETHTLESIDTYVVDPKLAWKRMRTKVHRPRDLAALQALAEWRETRAKTLNQPRNRILKDDAICELAIQRPSHPGAFDKLRAVPRGFGRSSAAVEIIDVIKSVEALPKDALPSVPNRRSGPSPRGPIGDLIRVLLKSVAESEGVAPRILATSDDIDAIVHDDDADVPALRGWRRKLFGDKALAIKHGRMALAANSDGVIGIEITPL